MNTPSPGGLSALLSYFTALVLTIRPRVLLTLADEVADVSALVGAKGRKRLTAKVNEMIATGQHGRLRQTVSLDLEADWLVAWFCENGWAVADFFVGLDEVTITSVLPPTVPEAHLARAVEAIREYFEGTGLEVEISKRAATDALDPEAGTPPVVSPEAVAAVAAWGSSNPED